MRINKVTRLYVEMEQRMDATTLCVHVVETCQSQCGHTLNPAVFTIYFKWDQMNILLD